MPKRKPEQEQTFRVWVDPKRKLVSFHAAPGCRLIEFHSRALFQSCIDGYTAQGYRYQ